MTSTKAGPRTHAYPTSVLRIARAQRRQPEQGNAWVRGASPGPQIWACPGCAETVEALAAVEVGHRCPSRRRRWVSWSPDTVETTQLQKENR